MNMRALNTAASAIESLLECNTVAIAAVGALIIVLLAEFK